MNQSESTRDRQRNHTGPTRGSTGTFISRREHPKMGATRTAVRRLVAVLTAHGPSLPEATPDVRIRSTR